MKLHLFVLIGIFCYLNLPAQDYCDSLIHSIENDELGYQNRGEICEGFYNSLTGGSIKDVGLHWGLLKFSNNSEETINIKSAKFKNNLYIRAQAIPLKVYFRMDSQLNDVKPKLNWKVNKIISQRKPRLGPRDLGIKGFYKLKNNTEILVPLKVESQLDSVIKKDIVFAIFRSSVDLESIQYRIKEKSGFNYYQNWKSTPLKSVDAGNPIIVPLDKILINRLKDKIVLLEIAGLEKRNKDKWLKCTVAIDFALN